MLYYQTGAATCESDVTDDNLYRLQPAARTRLLCYLVVAQLVGRATTGQWLRTDHLVEAARIGLGSAPEACGWQERIELARASVDLAPQFLAFSCFRDKAMLATLFTDGWALDYELPVVRGICDICCEHLAEGDDTGGHN
ncbi:hypothetical protein P3T43_004582 [Paraburkholderia sp. GAS41]|jgi:hypothetical protein|uniref:hypothetical protein n=1 Tax=Paraburkholderia sp. GAS41 TaxID=3035134 RepID=UPI003D1C1D4E